MSIPNQRLPDYTVQLVKAASELSAAAPELWRAFIEGLGEIAQQEYDRFVSDPTFDPNVVLVQKGRLKFTDQLGELLNDAHKKYRDHLEVERQIKEKEAKK